MKQNKQRKNRNMQRLGGSGLSLAAFANAKSAVNHYNPAIINKKREFYKNSKVVRKFKRMNKQEGQQDDVRSEDRNEVRDHGRHDPKKKKKSKSHTIGGPKHFDMKQKKQRTNVNMQRLAGSGLSLAAFANAESDEKHYNPALIASEEEQDEAVASEVEQIEETSETGEESEIERELANYTFGELQEALADGSRNIAQRRKKSETKPKRANKNRPVEESSKKPVRQFRQVINVPRREVRDPRFDSLSGNLDEEGFRKRYSFLAENLRSERENLRKQLNAANDPEVISDLKKQVNWVEKQLKSESGKHFDAEILADHKRKQREAIKQGKGIFFLKESEIRKQRLTAKYNALKDSGKLDAFLEKKRRRNAAKDRRYLPYQRPDSSEQ